MRERAVERPRRAHEDRGCEAYLDPFSSAISFRDWEGGWFRCPPDYEPLPVKDAWRLAEAQPAAALGKPPPDATAGREVVVHMIAADPSRPSAVHNPEPRFS